MQVAPLTLCLGAVFLGVGCAEPNPLDETSQGVGVTAASARSAATGAAPAATPWLSGMPFVASRTASIR